MTDRLITKADAIDVVRRTLGCSKTKIHADMRRGLAALATIASTAPFVGLMGTVLGIINAFRSLGVTHTVAVASVMSGISEALVTTALGLFVAVPSAWSYNLFVTKTEAFDAEAENASLELVTYLIAQQARPMQIQQPEESKL